MSDMEAKVVFGELFHPEYQLNKDGFQKMEDKYVSEAIDDEEIFSWNEERYYCPPHKPVRVFISAQTGKGKNYFITHNLLKYAQKNDQRILYISNRVALDYQQKQELAELTHTKLWKSSSDGQSWSTQESFSKVTVTTYQNLIKCFAEKEKKWFESAYMAHP